MFCKICQTTFKTSYPTLKVATRDESHLFLPKSLYEWKHEVKKRDDLRRKSALPDFLTAPENLRNKIANNHTVMPRMYRAHSQQGSERLELPNRMQRAYSHEGEVPCTLQPLSSSPHGRKI